MKKHDSRAFALNAVRWAAHRCRPAGRHGSAANKKAAILPRISRVAGFLIRAARALHAACSRKWSRSGLPRRNNSGAARQSGRERTYGMKDIASGAPMAKDNHFRNLLHEQPVTGVA